MAPDSDDKADSGSFRLLDRRAILKATAGVGAVSGLAGCLGGGNNGSGGSGGGSNGSGGSGGGNNGSGGSGGGSNGSGGSGGGSNFDGEFKIGVVIPKTGPASDAFEPMITGMEVALQEVNQNVGRGKKINDAPGLTINGKNYRVTYEAYDDQCQADKAVQAFERHVSNGRSVIWGSQCSGATLGMISVAKEKQVPLISSVAVSPKVTDPNTTNEWVFRNKETSEMRARSIANNINSIKNPPKTIGLIAVNSSYGTSSAEQFKKLYPKLADIEVVETQLYRPDQSNFSSIMNSMAQVDSDMVHLVPEGVAVCSNMIKQARQAGIERLIGMGYCGTAKAGELTGSAIEGLYTVAPYALSLADKFSYLKGFNKRYRQLSKQIMGSEQPPDGIYGGPCYDGFMCIMNAVQQAGSLDDSAAIRKEMAKTKLTKMNHPYAPKMYDIDAPPRTLVFNKYGQSPVQPYLARWQAADEPVQLVAGPGIN